MEKTLLTYLFAYLAGSINFAIIFFKLTGKGDPRLGFSGNAGTTNVYRQAGLIWASVVFLLDIGRAMVVAVIAIYFLEKSLLPWAGFFLVLGNTYPCFHGFRGGKGVANYLGFTLLVAPWAAVIASAIWAVVYGIVRIPFIASFFMVSALAYAQAFILQWYQRCNRRFINIFAYFVQSQKKYYRIIQIIPDKSILDLFKDSNFNETKILQTPCSNICWLNYPVREA
jgi:glycerol-3-phosphate acyltransferase PlsY